MAPSDKLIYEGVAAGRADVARSRFPPWSVAWGTAIDTLSAFFGRNGFLPHGICFTWTPAVLWTMVVSDLAIAAAYLSIPAAIISFVRKRGALANSWVAWLFSAFILACGTTHLMDVWTIWQPDYGWQALSKAVTAVISMAAAIALWPLIPKALTVPSAAHLQSVIASLEAEVQRRRRAEDTLDEIQQNLAVTLASIGAGFIATDREGRLTRLNGVAEHLTGWSQADALGQSLWKVLEREGRPAEFALKNPVDVVIEQGYTVDKVLRTVVISRDGRRTPVEIQVAPTREDNGTLRGLAIVLRDMTQPARAEAESARLAAVVESSSDAIISKTMEGRITTWNRAAELLFGYRADEAIGQPVQMLIPDDRQDEEKHILARLRDGQAVPAFDTQRLTKDKRVLDVSVSISPIRDRRGRLIGASKIARDITRERQDAAALRESEAQLRLADRRKDEFIATLSHELRNPLAPIVTTAKLLGDPRLAAKQLAWCSDVIQRQSHHLSRLLDELLDLSRISRGRLELHKEIVSLRSVVDTAVEAVEPALRARQHALHVDLPATLAPLLVDPVRLSQVVTNLLDNACKFTDPGGEIRLHAEARDTDIVLTVGDNGVGLRADELTQVFDMFAQVRSALKRSAGGLGIGLALTKGVVELHGGSITATSAGPGLGTVFRVVLPDALQPQPDSPASTGADAGAGVPGRRRVLLADDNRDAADVMAMVIRMQGHEVQVAYDGPSAIALAERFGPDVAVLDIGMPGMNGYEVARQLRRSLQFATLQLIALTGWGQQDDKTLASEAGFDDHLTKPADLEQLVQLIERPRPPARA